SLCSRPGSRKCTWVSMQPGSTCRPRASMRAVAAALSRSPMAAILPARTPSAISTRPPGVKHTPPPITRSNGSGISLVEQRFPPRRDHRPGAAPPDRSGVRAHEIERDPIVEQVDRGGGEGVVVLGDDAGLSVGYTLLCDGRDHPGDHRQPDGL